LKLKYTFREVDERLDGRDLELMSVSKIYGVIPRSELSDDQGRAESIDHYKVCRRGDLVINRMAAYQGALGVAHQDGAISPDYSVIRGEVDAVNFLSIFLKSTLGQGLVSSLLRGIGSVDSTAVRTPRLNWKDLADVDVTLPDPKEMREACAFLERETSQIDTLISKKEQLIEKLLERRQSLITQVVTKGLDPNAPMKDSGVEWLGEVPATWNVAKFKTSLKRSVRPSGLIKGAANNSKTENTFAAYSASGQDVFISELEVKPETEPGLVLSSVGARCGRTFLALEEKWGLVANTEAWVIANTFDPKFVWFLSQHPEIWVRGGSAQPYIQTPASLSKKVAWPDLKAQVEISAYLEKETSQIDQLVEKARKAIELLKERRQALITQVVTGKIDVRGFAGGNS
jgi:type I restriction enzyme S subunit